ncbi:MAG: 2-C-methyl-D-erythritol 4-phosphate cytidylyltransferase [Lachnospiraceae bacterium]|nr:2-C-methyl-D-erythritol 4-phosphate cytidylyltransferase [Lachnospiraceae bacterium]
MNASAVLVAGGTGSRFPDPSGKKKQYLMLGGKPLICWSLEVLQRSSLIEDIVLVVPAGDEAYVREEILTPGAVDTKAHADDDMPADGGVRFGKVKKIVAGGKERYHSVYEGLKAVQALHEADADRGTAAGAFAGSAMDVATNVFDATDRVVFIHDGVRPFLTEDMLRRLAGDVQKTGACVLAVPAKDTIKRADAGRMVIETLKREELWQMQTPQVFRLELALTAHRRLIDGDDGGDVPGTSRDTVDGMPAHSSGSGVAVTDDAMVVSLAFPEQRILLTEGSYRNLKVTAPEDLIIAEALATGMKASL